MYNDTIKVANKIITYDDLYDIFSIMNEKLVTYKKISDNEYIQNKMLDLTYQKWAFKDNGSKLTFDVDFYDSTSIKFDNYTNFIGIFQNRLHEIKNIHIHFRLSYDTKKEGETSKWYTQSIDMWIYETKADISLSLDSQDKKIDDIYELIKNRVLNAPIKYDDVIKNKSKISTTIVLAIGLIPAIITSVLLLLIPIVREMFATTYVLYPIFIFVLAFFIGGIISSSKLNSLYKNIVPEQKYAGYDSSKGKSVYKDDIDKYVETSEILIGKNVDNQKHRKDIMIYYEKYKKNLFLEIVVATVLSIIVLFLG